MAGIELIQFRYSPYNEKVRWALDICRLPHSRRSLLPGPHMRTVRKLTGQTKTPILKLDGQWLCGSARILDALDQLCPDHRLIPSDRERRARALEIEDLFDNQFGPAIRQAVLSVTMQDLGYMANMFTRDRAPVVAAFYRWTMPMAAGLIRKGNGIDKPGAYEQGMQAIADALAWVAEQSQPGGYLVGETFTIADLTAASMLAAVANPPDSPVARPTPMPRHLSEWLAAWHDHPGSVWVRDIYAKHRGARTDFEGASGQAS